MKVKEYILQEVRRKIDSGTGSVFPTSYIQDLAYKYRSEKGFFNGSPGSYEREWRRLREEGKIEVFQFFPKRTKGQVIWKVTKINE